MCKAIKPEKFLAVAFETSKREKLKYSELSAIRQALVHSDIGGESIDVDWDHDAVNYAFGFYEPVFWREEECVVCNTEKMRANMTVIIGELEQSLRQEMARCVRLVMRIEDNANATV